MERTYYAINEEMARQAHEMMSFRDYVLGTLTEEYKRYVDAAYDLADEAAKERPEEAERIYSMADRYAKKMADNLNTKSRIGCMCPSILISGGSNFPVRKKEKQNAAADRNYQEFKEIQEILYKIRGVAYGRKVIKSKDADAIEQLEKKLADMKALQERMKEANKAIRMKDTTKGNEVLRTMGYSDSQIAELRKPDFCGRVGFPAYQLQNNNANIRRVEERLKQLKATKETGTRESTSEHCRVVRNAEAMRLQMFFDGKPEPEVRDILKQNGFRWAPSQGAWQRHLNGNAEYALKKVMEELNKHMENN